MFIGHFGAGFVSKRADNSISLGTAFMAAQFMDLLWPVFLLLGMEKVAIHPGDTAFTPLNFYYYPFTHSMVSSLFWAFLFGAVYYAIRKNKKGAFIAGALVFSHWILDLITHRPDLEIIPGVSYKVGLGLWNSVPATMTVEILLYAVCVYFYVKVYANTKPKTVGLWILIVVLFLIYLANIFSPPPPDSASIGYAGLGMWLFVILAYWVDKR